jgi:NAD(P)-dependent dehydrogenase (short-subunit alcohol dehydrogenase family)
MTQPDLLPVALVTGAAQGIGLAISQHLLSHGWRVAIADINESAGAASLETLAQFREALTFIPCDVSQEAAVKRCIQTVLEEFGQLNGLVNNAGIATPTVAQLRI